MDAGLDETFKDAGLRGPQPDGLDIFDPVRSTRAKVKFSDNLSFLTAEGCVVGTIHQILHE